MGLSRLRHRSKVMKGDLVGTRREIERVYDLSKWFIGLMATMAVGILGLAVGNLVKTK